jgi:hypothetical protein
MHNQVKSNKRAGGVVNKSAYTQWRQVCRLYKILILSLLNQFIDLLCGSTLSLVNQRRVFGAWFHEIEPSCGPARKEAADGRTRG